jgi:hypothetical protein
MRKRDCEYQSNYKSSRSAKIEWLLKHQNLWEGWPNAKLGHDTRYKSIVDKMKEEGLVSRNTYYPDLGLNNLIWEARKVRREKQNEYKI